ncbi:TRAP transporter substrate-binding protein [Pseudovibrio sp. Tun.PSC04-5.I4]|uniref:TRAP transporter substrate-binding protein n=1 Tax=Pseudovibrio sp. Tun.PSC04-5.I4 TaxID=1798213 RepID=UPI00088D9C6F|nr:TRAP transporter substrate-binding protein [Pseudovibrio sp. Tun.PSC04-5.I4]SDR48415.1 TRAP-type C4-dicarboxylate transport system, substrate-binding protein [Pseudovibrio sp. Tun.PSC04-5.I4]
MFGNFKSLCASTALLLASVSMAGAADYTFKLHHFLSPKAPAQTKMLEPWAKAVEENSGGQVKIEIYPSMSLGGRPPELVNQVRDGVVDLVWTLNGYTPGLFPRTEVMELPLVFLNDPRAANLALYDMFKSELEVEYKGLEVMFLHTHAGAGLQTRNKEVRSPADMKGMRIRTPSRTGAWVIEALGASPAAMPVPELPTALQKGVIDAAFIPWEIIPPLKIQEQTEYQIEGAGRARFGTSVFQVSMNKARWEGLPEDIQKAFRDASGPEWWGKVGEIWRATDDFGIGLAVKSGNKHITLTDDETAVFQEALAPVVDRWISEVSEKGIDGKAIVAKAQALISKHSE